MSQSDAPSVPLRYRTRYGVTEVAAGGYLRGEATWFRHDRFVADDPSFVGSGLDHVFAIDRSDVSPQHRGYDSRCSCCWLGFSHTSSYHARSLERSKSR